MNRVKRTALVVQLSRRHTVVRGGGVCRSCSARHSVSALDSEVPKKFRCVSGDLFFINSVTSESQSIKRLSLRSNGIHFRIQRITLLFDIGLKPQETA